MPQPFDRELGAFVEEICADLCRFESAASAGCAPGQVLTWRGARRLAVVLDRAAPGSIPLSARAGLDRLYG